ncbi:hypothetical protein CO662_36170 [Rhizobium anhuiense]|uniref:Restriction endonuclease n=1 Tax=Rhizobium anhuiense TaxID=1184720 RepID=A0ABX4IZA9_9HYPH|nr:hypothetical protein [Rhizobium anhuiense]PDS46347.1 hypothetical protein CO662_36170 [Rhizobium anhuiense]
MRRKTRDPIKFDGIELFTAVARERGYELNSPGDLDEFMEALGSSLRASQTNPTLLHGKRVEAMFGIVAGALGRCKLIKQEDGGAVFATTETLVIPDYRIVLDDGKTMLVEVKNFHMKTPKKVFSIPQKTMHGLEEYAEINGLPLKIAVYFSTPNMWFLLSKKAFRREGKHFVIDFQNAMARNEMASLGERLIGTLPELAMELRTSSEEAEVPDETGQVPFIIREIGIYCGGREVLDKAAKDIAFYLVRYGRWPEKDTVPLFEGNKVIGLRAAFAPEEPAEEQGFDFVGSLSQMISSAYRELTIRDGAVASLDVKQHPEFFNPAIPQDFNDDRLPLWQMIIVPNERFGAIPTETGAAISA